MKKLISMMLVLGLIFTIALPTLAWEKGDDQEQDQVVAQATEDEDELGEAEFKAEKVCQGDLLYPLKRFGETLKLALTFNQQQKLQLMQQYAQRRVDEVNSLLSREEVTEEQIEATLMAYDDLIEKLDPEQAAFWEAQGITAEKMVIMLKQATKRREIFIKLADKHLEIANRFAERLQNMPEEVDEDLGKALAKAEQRMERAEQRIQTRILEMEAEGDQEGLQAMQQLRQKFQNKMETIKAKINERSNNRHGGGKK